jgi:NhaA family Na+:H+ antiporter
MNQGLIHSPLPPIREFLKLESASGILLVIAGALAMITANTDLVGAYQGLLDLPIKIQIGSFVLDKSLLIWVNDLLMAIFFLLIGLEIKREVVSGELSDPSRIALPALAAVGGMVVPVALYVWVNWGDAENMRGWAIPAATDIAFALGLLSLFGRRVPVGLKIFLMTLAVIDDLGAIVIIALFYSGDLSMTALAWAGGAIVLLLVMNWRGVTSIAAYILVGLALWVFVLKSGVHATLAGVITALMIPSSDPKNPDRSPVHALEHALHPWVAYGILPLFAFANAGVRLEGIGFADLMHPVPLGIILGLVVGKQLGVFVFSWVAIKSGMAALPTGVGLKQVYAASILTGIGFTMSLFIAMLAFENTASGEVMVMDRPGILVASLISAVLGYIALNLVLPKDGNGAHTGA